MTARCVGYRLVVSWSVILVAVSTFSRTALAHGEHGHGGLPVAFAVVVGLPVVVGIVAGIGAIAVRKRDRADQTDQYSTVVLGLLFVVLGGTFVIEAATQRPWLAFAGGTAGGIGTLWIAAYRWAPQRGDVCHTHLTCGAISLHRALEGFAVGVLYSAGEVVGLFGAVAIAGHTVIETGVLGGQYTSYRLEAVGAISLVHCSYAVGAVVGVVFTVPISVPVQSTLLALAGGTLCTVGVNETRNSDFR